MKNQYRLQPNNKNSASKCGSTVYSLGEPAQLPTKGDDMAKKRTQRLTRAEEKAKKEFEEKLKRMRQEYRQCWRRHSLIYQLT